MLCDWNNSEASEICDESSLLEKDSKKNAAFTVNVLKLIKCMEAVLSIG